MRTLNVHQTVMLGVTLTDAPEPVTVTVPPLKALLPTNVEAVLLAGGVAAVPALPVSV
jgi:hypothetical protein